MLPKFGMFLSINLDFWVVLLDAPYALPFSGCAIGTVVLSLLAADSRQRHHLSGRETGGGWGFQCRWFSVLNAFEAFMGQMNIVPVLGESFNQVGFGRFGVGQRNPLPVKSLLSFSFGSEFVHLQRFRPTQLRMALQKTVGLDGKGINLISQWQGMRDSAEVFPCLIALLCCCNVFNVAELQPVWIREL